MDVWLLIVRLKKSLMNPPNWQSASLSDRVLVLAPIGRDAPRVCDALTGRVIPRIHIWSESRPERVRTWIKDNGIGIDVIHHQRIFQVFERLHSNDTCPGTGIGLAIVAKSIERMKGHVWICSKPGAEADSGSNCQKQG